MAIKHSKIALMAAISLFSVLVVSNNLLTYDTNYRFVSHVLTMDTVFPANRTSDRVINTAAVHHTIYRLIIAAELLMALLCITATGKMICHRKRPKRFSAGKNWAIYGLTLGVVLWFSGFMSIGGEWFMMWQSKMWNGQQAAFRLTTVLLLTLIFISMPEPAPEE